MFDLSDSNQKHISHIDRLQAEGEHQRKVISDQDYTSKNLETDKSRLQAKVDDHNNTIRTQQNQIHQLDGDLNTSQRAHEDAKNTIQKLQV